MPLSLRGRMARVLASAALAASVIIPAAAPVAAAEPIIRAGTDQDLQVLNPWHSVTVVDYEIFTLNYDLLVGFGQNLEPVPGFAESWTDSADKMTHTFKIRPGMKWSDGEPATSEDARYTLSARPRRRRVGTRLHRLRISRAVPDQRGHQDRHRAGPAHPRGHDRVPHDPADAGLRADPAQAHLEQVHPRPDRRSGGRPTSSRTSRRSSARARTRSSNGSPGTSSGSRRTRTTGARRAPPTRSSSSTSRARTRWSRRCGAVRSTTSGASGPISSTPSPASRTSSPSKASPTATPTCRSTPRATPRATAARRRRSSIPSSAMPSATPSTTPSSSTRPWPAMACPGPRTCRPITRTSTSSRRHPRRFDIAEADRRLVAAGYEQRRRRQAARQGRQGHQPAADLAGFRKPRTRPTRSSSRAGSPSSASASRRPSPRKASSAPISSVRPTGRPTGTSTCGAGSGTRIRCRCCPSSRRVPSAARTTASSPTRATTSCSNSSRRPTDENERKAYIAEMQQIFYDNAPYIVLYYDSELHAYRTDKFGGWVNQPPDTGTPLFGYGPIGYTLLTLATAASPSPSAGASASAAPSGWRRRRRRRPAARRATAPAARSPVLLGAGTRADRAGRRGRPADPATADGGRRGVAARTGGSPVIGERRDA